MTSSQGPVKYVIGCWTCPGTTSIYTKEKCQSDYGVRGPQKTCCKAYLIHKHGRTIFALGEARRGALVGKKQRPVAEKCCCDKKKNQWIFFGRGGEEKTKTREDKRMINPDLFIYYQTALFGPMLTKSAHSLLVHWSFLLVHIQFTPIEKLPNAS